MRFKFIEEHQSAFSIGRMCHVMDVSPRGLRAFRSRPASRRQRSDLVTLAHIKEQSRLSLGSYPASEKLEIIRLVEGSHLSARQTLTKFGIPRTTFYRWYDRDLQRGDAGQKDQSPKPKHVRNSIPDEIRGKVVKLAFKETELSPRAVGRDLHGHGKLFCIRGFGLSRAESP